MKGKHDDAIGLIPLTAVAAFDNHVLRRLNQSVL